MLNSKTLLFHEGKPPKTPGLAALEEAERHWQVFYFIDTVGWRCACKIDGGQRLI
jgi:hypothetical protein